MNRLVSSLPPLAAECASASGRGAIAIVHLLGSRAADWIRDHFVPYGSRALSLDLSGAMQYGHWQLAAGSREEVVLSRLPDGRFELHCHGGPIVVQAILADVSRAGGELGSGRTWLASPEVAPTASAAWRALPDALTERTAAVLLDQARGALDQAIRRISQLLVSHPPEMTLAVEYLQALLAFAPTGVHLLKPWRIVLAGEPNVGKSSLLNALLGYERSIVWREPGTTRDVVRAITVVDGWPVELADTAGFREPGDYLEAAGASRARRELTQADLILVVVDGNSPQIPAELTLVAESVPRVHVANKWDQWQGMSQPPERVPVSALTGAGLESLLVRIGAALVPHPPAKGQAVPFLAEQVLALGAAREALSRGDASIAQASLEPLLEAPQ